MRNLKTRPIAAIVLLMMATLFCLTGPVEGALVVRTEKDIYNPDEKIRVYFANAPGNDTDWICIVPAGSPDTEGGDYKYMPRGLGKGSLIFEPRSSGTYEARAYYNYRRNGYVVSGRHVFSVEGDPAREEEWAQGAEPIDDEDSLEDNLPPPIPFVVQPNVVVLPGTDVYAVPDVEVDIFFQGGWWWRPWGGYWYRSQYYDHGWTHYRGTPSWHSRIPHGWRNNYRSRVWGGRSWNPPSIHHDNLNRHWRGGQWRNDHGWGLPGGRPAGRTFQGGGSGGRNLQRGGPARRTFQGGGSGGRNLQGGGTGGRNLQGDGPAKRAFQGGGSGGHNLRGSGSGGGKSNSGGFHGMGPVTGEPGAR